MRDRSEKGRREIGPSGLKHQQGSNSFSTVRGEKGGGSAETKVPGCGQWGAVLGRRGRE